MLASRISPPGGRIPSGMSWGRFTAVVAAFALIAAACSGYPEEQAVGGGFGAAEEATEAVEAGDAAEGAGGKGSRGARGGGGDAGASGSGGSGTIAGSGSTDGTIGAGGGSGGGSGGGGPRWPSAGLFSPQEERIGITDDEIHICMHAAFVFGEIFDNRPEDEDIYWDMVNAEQGGIYGRKVRVSFTDDQYTPNGAIEAASQCKSRNPFFTMGGVGFDQTPAVREWAERNRMLYFYSVATEKGAGGKRYSFTAAPSVEQLGRILARWVMKRYASKRVAIVYRDSPNWDGGRQAFKSELKQRGKGVVADIKVQSNQSIFTEEIDALQDARAQVVFFHENALKWIEMIKQARQQGYTPKWLGEVGFNLVTDSLGRDTLDPPAEVVWVTPSYDPTNPDLPWAKEIDRMERAYARYHPNNKRPNDVDWMFWLAFKGVHRMLADCGRSCTRNTLAGMLESGYQGIAPPLCPADYSRGHMAGYLANMFRAVPRGSGAVWQNVATCRASF